MKLTHQHILYNQLILSIAYEILTQSRMRENQERAKIRDAKIRDAKIRGKRKSLGDKFLRRFG